MKAALLNRRCPIPRNRADRNEDRLITTHRRNLVEASAQRPTTSKPDITNASVADLPTTLANSVWNYETGQESKAGHLE